MSALGSEDIVDADEVVATSRRRPTYSICTLVNNHRFYKDMLANFRSKGFTTQNAQFLYLDTTLNAEFDAYSGLNRLLAEADGEYVILCHQDVRLVDDEAMLRQRLTALTELDPFWGLAGNAGRTARGQWRLRITDRNYYDGKLGTLPDRVVSLDENFIVKRRAAAVGFSADLKGYHLYGLDIVTLATLAGWKSYVIDFHLVHFGNARTGEPFRECLDNLEAKYETAFRPRSVRTTVVHTHLGRLPPLSRLSLGIRRFWTHGFARRRRKMFYGLRDVLSGGRYPLDGIRFKLPASASSVARKAILKGDYERPERTLVARHLPADLPVIELGGAYGIVSRVVGRQLRPGVRHVVVEANPTLIALCASNAKAGAGHRLDVVNAALSYDDKPSVAFAITPGTHDSHLATGADESSVMVPSTTLAALLRRFEVSGAYALVVDIEGAEFDLFAHEAEQLSNCAIAIVEFHPAVFAEQGRSEADFFHLVDSCGFDIVEQMGTVVALRNRNALPR